jgi:hypothetical protein
MSDLWVIIRGEHLERHGTTELDRERRRLLRGPSDTGLDHGNGVGREQVLGLGLGEPNPAFREGRFDGHPRSVKIRGEPLGHRGRRLHERSPVLAVPHHVHEGAYRSFRGGVAWDLAGREQAARLLRGTVADPARKQRFLPFLWKHIDHGLGGLGAGGDGGRAVEHQHGV